MIPHLCSTLTQELIDFLFLLRTLVVRFFTSAQLGRLGEKLIRSKFRKVYEKILLYA